MFTIPLQIQGFTGESAPAKDAFGAGVTTKWQLEKPTD